MRTLIRLFLLLCCCSAYATDALLDLTDAQLHVGPYYTNRVIWLQPLSTPTINSPAVVLGTRIIITNGVTGIYVYTNLFPGLYNIVVTAPPSRDDFSFYFDATNLGTINISDYLVAAATATFPAGSVAWAAAVSDLRYARSTNVSVTFNQITNGLGYTPQPSSENLTNWSLLDTNSVTGKVGTNDVLGIGATNWVSLLGGGSTNQALLNPSLTNGVNRGNALSSRGTLASDEQFGNGASASGGAATAVGASALASGAQSISVGQGSEATASDSTALGGAAAAIALKSTALGWFASANNASSTALGQSATTTRSSQVMLGTSSDEVNVPGRLSVAGVTNTSLTANTLIASDVNDKEVSVTVGDGLSYDSSTRILTATGATSDFQHGSQNLTNWGLFDTNALTPIPLKTGTNDVLGIGATNWVAELNGGSTNQVLKNPSATNLVNSGDAIRSYGSVSTADQFGLSAAATAANALAVGSGATASAAQAVSVGYLSSAQVASSVALGSGATVQSSGSIAIGSLATSSHSGSTVIGPSATSSRANQITLGSGEEVTIIGQLNATGITNAALTASSLMASDSNKKERSASVGSGLSFSSSTINLVTDSTLSTGSGSLVVVGSALTGINASTGIGSGTVPTARLGSGSATSGTVLYGDSTWGAVGAGSVTSVGLSMPAEFSVASSPVTSSGTIAVTKASQSQNLVFASPTSGSGVPTFRALTSADLPSGGTYWGVTGNSGLNAAINFIGTTDNIDLVFKRNAGSVVQFLSTGWVYGNGTIGAGTVGSAIVSGNNNSIGAGLAYDVIAGGNGNSTGGSGGYRSIGGGSGNAIGGVSSLYAMIPGGHNCSANAQAAFAAGTQARANSAGSFVWADNQNSDFTDNGANTFNVRASGGVFMTSPSFTINGVSQGTTAATSVATDQNNSSTTLATTTLSGTLAAGASYTFELTLFVSDSVAADGVKVNFAGGSCSATTFRCETMITDTALVTASQTTALATTVSAATITGNSAIKISGFIKVNSGGTFIPQFAQNAHTAGTVTLYTGSFMRITPTS